MKSDLELKIENLTYEVNKLKSENESLKEELRKEKDKKEGLQYRIDNELEPRLKREACSYDAWVSCDRAAEAYDAFVDKIESLVDMVNDNPEYFDFTVNPDEEDLIDGILYCIKKELKISK